MLKDTRFIFVTGGVVSSLGKGIASASIGSILESKGYKVSVIKLDPYFKKPITVSINGKEFKTAGKLNMDLTLINLEQDSSIKIGDTVKLWDFDSNLSKVSEEFNTISYNLLTNISSRVTKNYLE